MLKSDVKTSLFLLINTKKRFLLLKYMIFVKIAKKEQFLYEELY